MALTTPTTEPAVIDIRTAPAQAAVVPSRTPLLGRLRCTRRKKVGTPRIVGALIVIGIYVLAALAGPELLNYDPVATDTGNRLLPPMSTRDDGTIAFFGTDNLGRDILTLCVVGARTSLIVGVLVLLVSAVVGAAIGLVCGYFGGIVDTIFMRIADIQLAFPGILLAILFAAVLGPSLMNVVIVLSVGGWVTFARVVRAQTLATTQLDYVDATRSLGAGHWHILRTAILPACIPPMIVIATLDIGSVILAEASLSFLGVGAPGSFASWGNTISLGRDFIATAWWMSTIPGICLSVLVVAFGVLGDAARDRFDPNLESQR